MRYLIVFVTMVFVALSSSDLLAQDTSGGDSLVRQLGEFGPIGDATESQKTWQVAREAMRERPGILIVPANVWSMPKPDSLQSLIRIPEPPASTKTWRHGPGLAVLTTDRERLELHVPPLSGVKIARGFRLNDGDVIYSDGLNERAINVKYHKFLHGRESDVVDYLDSNVNSAYAPISPLNTVTACPPRITRSPATRTRTTPPRDEA